MLTWAAQNAVVTLALAVVVAVFCRAGRLGPASRHALWIVVLIKLVTPPLVAWPWAVPIFSHDGAATVASQAARQDAAPSEVARVSPQPRERDYIVRSEVFTMPAVSANAQSREASRSASGTGKDRSGSGVVADSPYADVDWIMCLYVAWSTGALVMLCVHAMRIAGMRRRLSRATAAPEWLDGEVAEASASLGIRPPRVLVATDIPSPLVWACGRATLVWPAGLLDHERRDAWCGVIVHELAHLRRRDHWTGWLELAASCPWWFNPVFWYARGQLRENAELACDAWVVRTLPDGRRNYAEALLAVCEFEPQTAPPLPALGVHSAARRALERRLTMILRERLPVRVSRGAWIAAALLAAIAVPNWYLIAAAQPVAVDAAPPSSEPSTAETPAAIDPLAESLPYGDELPGNAIPAAAEPPVRVPDGGTVLLGEPIPPIAPAADSPPGGVGTPWPTLPESHDNNTIRSNDGPRRLGLGAASRPGSRQQPTHVVDSNSFTLTRTTYRVPRHIAENLQNFVEQNLSWPHLMGVEVKQQGVERQQELFGEEHGEQTRATLLTVTASPDAQEVIGNLIGLMLESKPRAVGLTTTYGEASDLASPFTGTDLDPNGRYNSSQPRLRGPSRDTAVTE